jgi:hypothetical protein
MRRARSGAQAAVAFGLWIAASTAAAQAPRRIVLLAAPEDPLAGRLGAEIAAQGMTCERRDAPPAEALEATVRAALAAGARVAVVADADRRRAEVWSAAPGRVALKQVLEVAAPPDDEEAALPVLALRTVELLRVDFGLGAPPPASAPPPPRAPSSPVSVTAASGLLASTGRIGPLPIAGLGLAIEITRVVGGELWGYAPLVSDRLTTTAGSAETTVWLAGAGLLLAPYRGPRLAVDLGSGPMLALVRASGSALPPAAGTTDQQLGVAIYGRVGARLRAGAHWSFGVQLLGGGAVRRPVITFVDQDVTRWGSAFVVAVAGAHLTF